MPDNDNDVLDTVSTVYLRKVRDALGAMSLADVRKLVEEIERLQRQPKMIPLR